MNGPIDLMFNAASNRCHWAARGKAHSEKASILLALRERSPTATSQRRAEGVSDDQFFDWAPWSRVVGLGDAPRGNGGSCAWQRAVREPSVFLTI